MGSRWIASACRPDIPHIMRKIFEFEFSDWLNAALDERLEGTSKATSGEGGISVSTRLTYTWTDPTNGRLDHQETVSYCLCWTGLRDTTQITASRYKWPSKLFPKLDERPTPTLLRQLYNKRQALTIAYVSSWYKNNVCPCKIRHSLSWCCCYLLQL